MNARALVLCAVAAALAALALSLPPLAQPPAYHDFADQRACFGLPNCLDTASNVLFVVVGVLGLRFLLGAGARDCFIDRREATPYRVFFAAVALIGVASGHYHLGPDHAGLAGDRAAMALAFMAWLAALLAERAGVAAGLRLLPWLLGAGLASVVWWIGSESAGRGDLRAYLLVQALPIVLVPLLLWLYPPRYDGGGKLLAVIGLYLVALLLDLGDDAVFAASGGLVSGHTLKHAVAAFAAWRVLHYLRTRRAR